MRKSLVCKGMQLWYTSLKKGWLWPSCYFSTLLFWPLASSYSIIHFNIQNSHRILVTFYPTHGNSHLFCEAKKVLYQQKLYLVKSVFVQSNNDVKPNLKMLSNTVIFKINTFTNLLPFLIGLSFQHNAKDYWSGNQFRFV